MEHGNIKKSKTYIRVNMTKAWRLADLKCISPSWIVKVFNVHSWEKAVTLMNKIFKKHPIVVPFDQVSNLKDRVLLVKP